MPRYFFHIYDDAETLDLEGLELPSLEAAIGVATHELGRLAADELKHQGRVNTAMRIDVTLKGGQMVASVHFDDLLDGEL